MDKFLLAENPMRPLDGWVCILKTVAPIAVFEVLENHHTFLNLKYRIIYRNYTMGQKTYCLRLHYYGGFKGNPPSEREAEKQAVSDMDNAWHWFKAYKESMG